MSYLKTPPILPMEAGPERELMACFLERVKRIKGLTTVLVQTAGVNAKWLKPEEPKKEEPQQPDLFESQDDLPF